MDHFAGPNSFFNQKNWIKSGKQSQKSYQAVPTNNRVENIQTDRERVVCRSDESKDDNTKRVLSISVHT